MERPGCGMGKAGPARPVRLNCQERGRVDETRPEEQARSRPFRTCAMRKIWVFFLEHYKPIVGGKEECIFIF